MLPFSMAALVSTLAAMRAAALRVAPRSKARLRQREESPVASFEPQANRLESDREGSIVRFLSHSCNPSDLVGHDVPKAITGQQQELVVVGSRDCSDLWSERSPCESEAMV